MTNDGVLTCFDTNHLPKVSPIHQEVDLPIYQWDNHHSHNKFHPTSDIGYEWDMMTTISSSQYHLHTGTYLY